MQAVKARRERDMTSGPIVGNLFSFALPLLIGNLFQQLYNMVDTWVIGQTGESGAFAAVGSVGPIVNIMVGIFSGFSSGAGVVISRYFGAHDEENVSRSVHTAVTVTLLLSAVFTALGVLLSPLAVRLMLGGTDGEVYPHAVTYLTIYFAGCAGLLIYNMSAAVLRAVGNSRYPFYFLLVSAVTNIVLDLLFVFCLGMGVAGVAIATVIAQLLSAILATAVLFCTRSSVRLSLQKLGIHTRILKKQVIIGIPAAIQLALTAFSNVFVQSYIGGVEGDQTAALGGWTAYSKIDMFLFLPSQSLSLAATTFVGQNLGAGDAVRARRGVRTAFLMALTVTVPITVLVILLAPHLAGIFNSDPAVVANATLLLRYITPFYIFTCANQIFAAGMRGAGNSLAPMVIMLTSFVGFRQLYLFIVSNYVSNDLLTVGMAYPAGWGICCLVMTVVYFSYRFDSSRE